MATLLIMALKEESQQLFEQNNIHPYYCGVGQVKAAFMTQELVHKYKPERIVNLGTAGSHTFQQGYIVECTSFVQRIANNFYPLHAATLTTKAITHLPQAICGSADFIEKNNSLVKCDVMDMEAYAMAYACQQLGIAFTSIKYVTDNSDENLVRDWKAHLKMSSEKLLQEFLKIKI